MGVVPDMEGTKGGQQQPQAEGEASKSWGVRALKVKGGGGRGAKGGDWMREEGPQVIKEAGLQRSSGRLGQDVKTAQTT